MTTHLKDSQGFDYAVNKLNPVLNAVLVVIETKMPSTQLAKSEMQSLAGARVLVKDCMDVSGSTTSYGSEMYANAPPATSDAFVVRKIQQSGGCIVGKTNLDEFCFGATGLNAYFGRCNNPWDIERIPGGSSGGSAAAVAAGIAPMALGTDTGGSVRVPAALCGIYGLRPTFGRVSNHGVLDVSTICDTVGPMAARMCDLIALYCVISGFDRTDPISLHQDQTYDPSHNTRDCTGMKIGIPTQFYTENLAPDIASALEAAIKRFSILGANIKEFKLRDANALKDHNAFRFVLADVADARRYEYEKHPDKLGAEVKRRIELGYDVRGIDYAVSIRALQAFTAELRNGFIDGFDAILTPTTPITAPLWSESQNMVKTTRRVAHFTYDIGATGMPSLSIPAGLDRKGLPIGLQLTASWGNEAALFKLALAFEGRDEAQIGRPPVHALA